MKVYIAGKLGTDSEREKIETVANICESLELETFVPHRNVGICKGINDVDRIFKEDIMNGFKNCDLVIALLDGIHIGAGTAWELGYAYANKIPCIGLRTEESFEDSLDSLSAILISSVEIVSNLENLKEKIVEILNLKSE